MRPDRATPERWAEVVNALQEDDRLRDTNIGAGLLAALALGLTSNSRGFANDFGLAHALVLREIGVLADELNLIAITREDEKTQRRFLSLTEEGERLTKMAVADPTV